MTRQEHLKFCKLCSNRKLDLRQGLVCSLTDKIADFNGECEDFIRDESVKEEVLTEEQSATETISALPEEIKEKLRLHQDLFYALVGGFFVTVICALLWAVITVTTEYQIGYMAVGLGLAVGMGVRFFGSGIDPVYGIVGGLLALLGCAMGNLFSQVGFYAQTEGIGYFETLTLLNPANILLIFQDTFSPMDVLFYGIAAYEGYKFAFRPIPSDISQQKDLTPDYAQYRLPLAIFSFILISVAAYSLSRGLNGPHTYYYESGVVMSKGEYVKGELNGPWTYFDEFGKKQVVATYENGVENGVWVWYSANGMPLRKGNYKNGLLDGPWLNYHENGLLSDSSNYTLGRLMGESISYYDNGQAITKGEFHRDRQEGLWVTFHENGKKSAEGNFDNGELRGIWKYWNQDGSPLQEFEYGQEGYYKIINAWDQDGRQIVKDGFGEYRSYFEDGTLLRHGRVEAGRKVGTWQAFHPNGQLQEEGFHKGKTYKIINTWNAEGIAKVAEGEGEYITFLEGTNILYENGLVKEGLKEGYWQLYHDNSFLQQESNYLQGKLHGKSTSYHSNGNVYTEGIFEHDIKEGEWSWFYESGQLQCTVTFVNDKKEGPQIFWSESGRQAKEEIYEGDKLVSERVL